MSSLYQNRYRVESARLKTWNYANAGMYFVTICTQNRKNYFGEGKDGMNSVSAEPYIQLSTIGKIAYSEWLKTIEMRADMNLQIGEFVVMPNHFHGIIIIGENKFNGACTDAMHHCTDATHRVSATPAAFAPQSKNLASIIRGYKSAVTTYARILNIEFGWQPRYHDHIIRSMDEYIRISNYIMNNPAKWLQDKFHNK